MIATTLLVLASHSALAQPLTFKDHGKPTQTLEQAQLDALTSTEKLEVYDPNAHEKTTYRGYSFQQLLTKVYGDRWKQADEILFTCSDGFQPSIPVAVFRDNPALLAFGREGGEFEMVNKNHGGEKLKLGPYYMVWENLKNTKVKNEGEDIWAYQLTMVDLVSFNERFPKLAPPKNASTSAKRGFLTFRKYCLACHAINGEGGARGVELNAPHNPTEYWKPEWLRRWIDNPRSIRASTIMPAFSADADNRARQIDDVIAYLAAMVRTH